jgi:glycosyltransferase involved in cell wall biosynthesis
MLIDVIIPTFNRAYSLPRAIQSVLNQTHKNFNLIVVDDGSSDGTADLMEKDFKHPKIKFYQQSNSGVSSARNFGIMKAQAEWVAFLDSDDEWLPQKLSHQVRFAQTHPHLRFIHSNEIWMRHGQRVNPKNKFDKSHNDIFRRSLELCLISPSTVMMKKVLAETHGLFDETYPVCEDYDLWLKILAREEVGFIKDNLIIKYGGHDDQLSTRYNAMDFWRIKSMLKLLESSELTDQMRLQVEEEIDKKANIVLQGYLKHNNHAQHEVLSTMLKDFFSRRESKAGFP